MASNSSSFHGLNYGHQIGANYGPIYAPIERRETPPAPLSTCPFRRDPDFVDRGSLLEEIYQRGCAPAARIALVGLGGVGKSQLAIQCCYQIEDRSPQTWVFWIHAANAERFEQSCRDIANRIKIRGRNDPKAKVSQLLHDWLADKRNGKWVIILDNVDDSRFLHDVAAEQNTHDGGGRGPQRSLLEQLPISRNGSIIVTSRSRGAVSSIVDPGDMIMIGPMDATEATTLFAKKLGVQITEDVSQLAKELDHMPLAIAQAAALIKHMEPRLSVSQYLRRSQKSEREKIRFLAHDQGQLSRDKEAHNSIIVTWQMSFDHIRRTHPSAADLLSLMCFFDRQGIPEKLIRRSLGYTVDASSTSQDEGCGDYDDFESTTQDADHATEWTLEKACTNEEDTPWSGFERSISTLRDYSLISTSVDGTSFQMHRLVQLAMRRWLETHKQTERWKRSFVRTLFSEVQDAEYENWPVCELVLPHVLSAVTQPPIEETTMEKWAAVIHVAAAFTCHRGDHSKSAELASLASETTGRLLGPYHESTLCSLGALAVARECQGQYKAAEEILVQLLEIRKRILGSEHPQTVTIMHDLATLYYHQGRYIEAENIGFQALEIRKRILGLNHPATLMSMGNLAAFRGNQGRYSEAEMDELQLLEMRKRLVGPDHPATLCSMSNLATTYFDQGRYIEAEDILVQVVEIRKRIIGWDHPDTLGSLGNLASIYLAQGRHREAEDIGVQVLETRQRILGWDHPDTLYGMNNLAFIYFDQGRYTESEQIGRQAIKMRNRIIGPEHPDTMVSMKNYAVTLWYLGQHESALLLLARCTELSTRVLGPQHPCTNTFLGCLDRCRQIYNHLPPQTTGAPFERPPEAICRFDSQSTSAEASDEASGPSKARKRTMLTRLFRKKKMIIGTGLVLGRAMFNWLSAMHHPTT